MKSPILLALAVAGFAAAVAPSHSFAASAGSTDTLPLTRVLGGALKDPVLSGDYAYIPSGRVINTWNYADPAAPHQVAATAVANGVIQGLTRWGDYLYASWQRGDDNAGIAVYSLADPAKPMLVNQFDDYTPSSLKLLWTVAAANGYLYLFDQENGIYFGDLGANPQHPTFTRLQRTPITYDRSYVEGNYVYVSGTTTQADPRHVCAIFDVSNPSSPVGAGGCGGGVTPDHFRSRVRPPLAVDFGLQLALVDVTDPHNAVPLGSVESAPATDGFLYGDRAYTVGFAGIDMYDISNRSAPVLAGHSPIPTLGTDSVSMFDDNVLLLTSTDRFARLKLSATNAPSVVSSVTPAGGAVSDDVAIVDGKAVVLQENYGLGIFDADTLQPLARFDVDLPEQLNLRDFEQFAVDGHRAYLTAWGYGLVVVDLADPLHPAELGRVPFDFASTVAANGNFAYIGTVTNVGYVQVVDVSDPARPTLRGNVEVGSAYRLKVRGNYVFVADALAGMRVVDVSNPDAPALVALYDNGCLGFGGAAYDVALSEDGKRAFVACESGLHILDVSVPAAPQPLGVFPASFAGNSTVEVRGNRAWFGDAFGLHEIDITNPVVPVEVGTTDIGSFAPTRLRALDDGRLFLFQRQLGIHVFGERAIEDAIFKDGFDGAPPAQPSVSDYDDLGEGFLGTQYAYNGVNYHDVNGIGGVFPDGSTFTSDDVGDQLIVENATDFFTGFPDFGSVPNVLTFGTSFIAGGNLSLGPLVRMTMDLDQPASAAQIDLAFYENGPWGGIELHMDAYSRGTVVASDTLTIADGGGRDNVTTSRLAVSGATFDSLKIYATFGGEPSAPRVLLDHLVLTPAP